MRTLRFSQIEPSADALATLSNKLQYYSEQMRDKPQQNLKEWSLEFERLAAACWTSIQNTARRKWAAAAWTGFFTHKIQQRSFLRFQNLFSLPLLHPQL